MEERTCRSAASSGFCGQFPGQEVQALKSVYCNAQVYTGEDAQGQAFLVEDGFFTAVGSDQEILALAGQDAIEAALKNDPRQDHRHGIVHCQITRPDQLERIAGLKLHVYAQTVFLDYDNHIVESRVGAERARSSYRWKTLMNRGVSVSNGSDSPVELPDVMRGIECAVTRTSMDGTGPYLPEEAFSVKEALDSYTIRGAEASFEEHSKGRIALGYVADFTVLEHNPFMTEPGMLHTIAVHSCYLGNRCVYMRTAADSCGR